MSVAFEFQRSLFPVSSPLGGTLFPPLPLPLFSSFRMRLQPLSKLLLQMARPGNSIQLPLDRHSFELLESTSTSMFFHKHTVGHLHPQVLHPGYPISTSSWLNLQMPNPRMRSVDRASLFIGGTWASWYPQGLLQPIPCRY